MLPAALFGPASPAAAYPSSTVVISGHGYGHGIGMGQWGSLGYAIGADNGAGNDTYQQILAHYYGNTTLTSTNDSTAMHGGNVWVAMTEANAIDTIVSASSGSVSYGSGSAPAVLFHQVGTDLFQIETGPGCGGPWSDVGSPVVEPVASPPPGALLDLCTPSATIEVHGTLQAVTNSAGLSRTVNIVPIEQYVADVAPAESPSSWSLLGGAGPGGLSWGFQQSEAQTVAARSYVRVGPPRLRRLRRHLRPDLPVLPGRRSSRRSPPPRRPPTRPARSWRRTARWPPPSTRPPRAGTRRGTSSPPCPTTGTPSA